MLWIDLLVIRWLLWRGDKQRAAVYASTVIRDLRALVDKECDRIAKVAKIDVPKLKETRIIRASADVFKIGQVVKIDHKDFVIARLLSASKRETIYEVVSQ
jgi:hypothetical protein